MPRWNTEARRLAEERMRRYPRPTDRTGICECGCGQPTPIATATDVRHQMFRGVAQRFVRYHHLRGMTRGEGRYVNNLGYVLIRKSDHAQATKGGYVLEHRWVMEQKIGRPLLPAEAVHHRNHDRTDNRPENLELLNRREHGREHGRPKGVPHTAQYRIEQSARMKAVYARKRHQMGPASV